MGADGSRENGRRGCDFQSFPSLVRSSFKPPFPNPYCNLRCGCLSMAKKKLPAPPPAAHSDSSEDDDSSSDEERKIPLSSPPGAKTPKRARDRDESDSESESESDSDTDHPIKTPTTPLKPPSESEDESSEEEDDEDEPKLPDKKPESKPDKKKAKLSTPDQSPKKLASAIQRIWTVEDEMALLRGLSDYYVRNGNLPRTKDYGSFLSSIKESIGFPVTEKQLFNKIRHLRHQHGIKKKKGFEASSSNHHENDVFKMCTKLFDKADMVSEKMGSKKSKKRGSLEIGSTSNGGMANGGTPNGSDVNADDGVGSNVFLGWMMKDIINKQQFPGLSIRAADLAERIGKSKVRELEAKAKMLRIDAMKLHAREEKLNAELLDIFANVMADDK